MLIDRALTLITATAWFAFAALILIYLIRLALRSGIGAALRALFSRWPIHVTLVTLIALTLLSEGLVFIEPQEVGVVVSVIAPDGYRHQPFRSGLRWIAPMLEEVYRYPLYWQTYTMSSRPTAGQRLGDDSIVARTSDGQEVRIECSVIFQIDPGQAIGVHVGWQERYIEDFIRPVVRGIVQTQISQFTVDEVNSSQRLDLAQDMSEAVRLALSDGGFTVDRFILRTITFSPEYAAAVERKQMALQQALQREHEADQIRKLAQGEADAIKIKAEAEAEATRKKAQAEAEALQLLAASLEAQGDRLLAYRYIDKLAPGIRVMLVPGNAPYILPLPALEPEATPTPTQPPASEPTPTPTPGP